MTTPENKLILALREALKELENKIDMIADEYLGSPGDGDLPPDSYEQGAIDALVKVKEILFLIREARKEVK